MTTFRVFELAKELNVSSIDIIEYLRSKNKPVHSRSSVLTDEQVEVAKRGVDYMEVVSYHRHTSSHQRVPFGARKAQVTGANRPRPKQVRVSELSAIERVVLEDSSFAEPPRNSYSIHLVEMLRETAKVWVQEDVNFADPELLREWLGTGLSPAEAKTCVEYKITPEMLAWPFDLPGRARGNGTLSNIDAIKRCLVTVEDLGEHLLREGKIRRR